MKTTTKPKKTTQAKYDGYEKRWYATKADVERLRRLTEQCASADGFLKPSHAVLIRAGLMLLDRHMSELIAVGTRAL